MRTMLCLVLIIVHGAALRSSTFIQLFCDDFGLQRSFLITIRLNSSYKIALNSCRGKSNPYKFRILLSTKNTFTKCFAVRRSGARGRSRCWRERGLQQTQPPSLPSCSEPIGDCVWRSTAGTVSEGQ